MAALLTGHGRPGFYFRVLEEGVGQARRRHRQGRDRGWTDDGRVHQRAAVPGPSPRPRAASASAADPRAQPGLAGLVSRTARAAAQRRSRRRERGLDVRWGHHRPGQASEPCGWSRSVRRAPPCCHWSSKPTTARRWPRALPGQFVTLKLEPGHGAPPLVRSYSLSGPPDGTRYRITVKVEPHGAAGRYLRATVDVGDRIKVAAPRGQFTLDDGARPVVLVSAGVGVTPVLAMLHALHDSRSTRDIWWLHGARNGAEHAFAQEARSLLATLPNARSRVWYSRPGPDDHLGTDYDELGHITRRGDRGDRSADRRRVLPVRADPVHDCDPCRPRHARRADRPRAHRDVRRRGSDHARHRPAPRPATTPARRHPGHGPARVVRADRHERPLGRHDSPASSSSPKHATYRFVGRAGPVCAIPARPASWRATSPTHPEPLEPPAAGNLLVCCSQPRSDLAVDL